MKSVKALIITGYGINCEKEMAFACKKGGAEVTVTHINDLLNGAIALNDYHLLGFPGGFSFADDLGAAKAFANRLTYSQHEGKSFKERLHEFVQKGNCIIGICNGFQLLVKLGLLPSFVDIGTPQQLSLVHNDSQQFENRWTHHKVLPSPCVFTKDLESLYLPVRHGEGKLVAQSEEVTEKLFRNHQVVLQYSDINGTPTENYPDNPNGSTRAIGGVCDETGRVFGMMAHPEAALFFTNLPHWQRLKTQASRIGEEVPLEADGYKIFENGMNYLRGIV